MQAAIPLTIQANRVPQPFLLERRRSADAESEPTRHDESFCREGRRTPLDVRQVEVNQIIDMIQELLGAAFTGDTALFALWRERVISFIALRRHAAGAAAAQIESVLRVEVISRHMLGCSKRRGLQRELENLTLGLKSST